MAIDMSVGAGHPTQGVFMKCWRCQGIHCLVDDGYGGLRCPQCRELLITLEDPEPLEQEFERRIA
jgi:hypothetical protein